MSQAGLISNSSELPVTVPLVFHTDSGDAVSSANAISINGLVNIKTAGSGSDITIRADILTYIQPGSYPYIPTSTDYFISVDTSTPRTIQLPDAPVTGKTYVIKDRSGDAAVNNITVTTVGGAVLIDGQTSQTINDDYESFEVLFNGTSYEVF